jgi:hypothetical protein
MLMPRGLCKEIKGASPLLLVLMLLLSPLHSMRAAAQTAAGPVATPPVTVAAPATAPTDPTLVISASAASLDKVAALTAELGIGNLPFFSTKVMEQQMPFIGPGGLAGDRPIGVLFYFGPQIDMEKSATFVLPVNPGKAELKTFLDNGAKPVAARTDLVTLEGVSFRRAKDQFIFGQMAGAVSAVREDALTAAHANDATNVARVDFDIEAFKKAFPDRHDAFFIDLDNLIDVSDFTGQAFSDLSLSAMRELNRIGVSLSRGEAGALKLGINAEPVEVAKDAVVKFPRPGFPAGTVFRADIAYPPAKAFSRVTHAFTAIVEKQPTFTTLTAPQQQQARGLISRVSHLFLGGETASLGLERIDGQPVVYWMVRGAGAVTDVEREMREIVEQTAEVTKLMKIANPFAPATSYVAAAGGVKVNRLVLLEEGKPGLHIDAVQREGAVMMSIAWVAGNFVERLLPLAVEGEAGTLVSGWVDLSALASTGLLPDAQAAGLDPKAVADLPAALKGQRLDWTISPDGTALRIDVNIPKVLLQNVAKAMHWIP